MATLSKPSSHILALGIAWIASVNLAHAQAAVFTYQGQLTQSGTPFTGSTEVQATLWDALGGGLAVATNTPPSVIVGVTNGLFVLPLDFGSAPFAAGAERWLQLEVRTTIGPFTPLAPRQKLTPTPYALTAAQLSGTLPSATLGGTYSGTVAFNNAGNAFNGSFTGVGTGLTSLNASQWTSGTVPNARLSGTYGNALIFSNPGNNFAGEGRGLTALSASQLALGTVPDARLAANVARTNQVWLLGGNAGTTAGAQFLGTTDDKPLELKVNGRRGLRIEPNTNGAPNLIGGSLNNFVEAGVVGAFIGGGGATNFPFVTDNRPNVIGSHFGVIGGGFDNSILTNSRLAVIVGGRENEIQSSSSQAAIVGGERNIVGTNSQLAIIVGGSENEIQGSSSRAAIVGGERNTVGTNSQYAFIGSGFVNSVRDSRYGVIGSGFGNNIRSQSGGFIGGGVVNQLGGTNLGGSSALTTNAHNAIVGGAENWIAAGAANSFIGGGLENFIGQDVMFATVPGGRGNQVTGDYSFAAGRNARANHDGTFVWGDSASAVLASTSSDQFIVRARGGMWFGTNNSPSIPAGRFINTSAGGFLSTGGAWTDSSDRNAKENFQPVDRREILERVTRLPVATWNYKAEASAVRHIGPVAQEFYSSFGVGQDDQHIAPLDANGVALAAIQGLNQKLEDENQALRTELKLRDALLADLERRLAAIERRNAPARRQD